MFKKIFTLTLSFLLLNIVMLAQSGKISGRVTDSQTGEPLIGANVIVLNTDYGAATDINGEYSIANIPPGVYSLKASYIGYQNVTIQNIRVVTGLTQEVDFPLPSSSFATEEVVIVSERPLIEKSSTNAVRIVDSEALEVLPTRSITSIAALQPGVVLQNYYVSIRGSRPNETGYVLEGTDVKDPVSSNGGNLVYITPDAIEELLVHAGGYTAEYGNANAGIIQTSLKTGKDKYHFSLRGETDNFGNYPGDKFLGTYSYGYSDLVFTASGPIVSDKIKFFVSGENYFIRDTNPIFLSASPETYSDGSLVDETVIYDNGTNGGSTEEGQILSWEGGNIPGVFLNRYSFAGTLLMDFKPLIVKLSAASNWSQERMANSTGDPTLLNMFNTERYPMVDRSSFLLNAKGTYLLSDKMFIEGEVSFLDSRFKQYDPYFKDDVLAYSDSAAAAAYGFDYYSYYTPPVDYDFYGFPFTREGALLTSYYKRHYQYMGGSLDFTSQMEDHEFKAGVEYKRWTIRNYSFYSPASVWRNVRENPDRVRSTEELVSLLQESYSAFNNYGYDILGNESDEGLYDARHPVFASAYIQDKYESDDIIINAGLRFDLIDMDTYALVDEESPSLDDETNALADSSLKESSTFMYVTPRLGFSFPVTDRTVFHMQYGKFIQSTALSLSYKGVHRIAYQMAGAYAFNDPLAFDLEPVKTTQYEIGFSQQFTDFAAFDATAFYKDIVGLPVYAIQEVEAGLEVGDYAIYANQDFATTRGIEFSLKIRRTQRVRLELNYTYSDAKGTNSFSSSGFGSVQSNGNVPTIVLALDYNQTHRGSMMFDYRFEKGDGGPIFERLGLNVLFTFNSGHPYTLAKDLGLGQEEAWTGGVVGTDTRQRSPNGPPNSLTTPWVYNFDLKVDKTVSIWNFDVNFYVYVQNVLNTKNVINVYDKTGSDKDDGFLSSEAGKTVVGGSRYTERFADLYRSLNLENRQHYWSQKGYDIYDTPRQLRLGILVNF